MSWSWGSDCRPGVVLPFCLFEELASEKDLDYLGSRYIMSVKTTDIVFEIQVDVLASHHEGLSRVGNLRKVRANGQAGLQCIMATLNSLLFEPVLILSFVKCA